MLVLVPHDRTDLTWIQSEISRFEAVCPTGRLVVLKFQADPIPDTLRERQIIDVSARTAPGTFSQAALPRAGAHEARRSTEPEGCRFRPQT